MPTKVLPESLIEQLKRSRPCYQFARALRMKCGGWLGARRVPGLPGRVHYNDFMLVSASPRDVEKYRNGALAVMSLLDETLRLANKDWRELGNVLDFGCGYGRTVRFLTQRIDAQKVLVCDHIEEAAKFCRDEFKVRTVPEASCLADFHCEPVDLLYFISVHTHLSARKLHELQAQLRRLLKPHGACLFTTHGCISAEKTHLYGHQWERRKAQISEGLQRAGYYFCPYEYYPDPDYGMTWVTLDFVANMMKQLHGDALSLLTFKEAGLDGHQDVFVYQRTS